MLVVDDEPLVLESLAMLLEDEHDIETAGSASEARQILENSDVDVVVSDQRMPGERGTELLTWVRQTRADTYRILLTGFSDADAMAAAINDAAVWHFLRKPWDNHEVRTLLRRAVEARRARQLLAESQRRYEELFHTAPVGLVRADSSGALLDVNRALRNLTQGLVGSVPQLVGERTWELLLEALEEAGRVDGLEMTLESDNVPVRATASLMRRPGQDDLVQIAFADLRPELEIRRTSGELARAQSLSALPLFVAGAIHDFKNHLSTVSMNAELLEETLADDAELAACASDIARGAQQALELSHELLDLGRVDGDSASDADPDDVIARLGRLFRRAVPRDVRLQVDTPQTEPLRVALGPRSLHHALVNLVMNALDAMKDTGGKLTVSRLPEAVDGRVILEVRDTGRGMSPEVLAACTSAFYTTDADSGTGLGLPTVQRLVEQAGGRLQIDSELGRGTTVSLHLPQVFDFSEGPTAPLLGRRGVVVALVDAPEVRGALRRLIHNLGFPSISADSAHDAWSRGAAVALVDARRVDLQPRSDALVVMRRDDDTLIELERLAKPCDPEHVCAAVLRAAEPIT